jgi:hypothetical protein
MKLIRFSRRDSMPRFGVVIGDRAIGAEDPWPEGKQTPRRQSPGATLFH